MSRPIWFVQLVKKAFPTRNFLARMTHTPLLGSFLSRWLFGGDQIFYLPQDRVIHIDHPLAPPDEIVLPSQILEHFIQRANTHWIMNTCICRDAASCRDYPVDLGCLFLGQAVLDINPQLGRLVTREEALDHVRRCHEAGLVHIIGRNKLDTVWLGVGPDHRLLTICHCCPCCCLWRILPDVAPGISERVTRLPGVSVNVTDACAGCGECTQDICFVDAIHLQNGRAVISDACRGCGRCADVCPQTAIQVRVADSRLLETTIAQISTLVDVT
jgi:ferredoxin